MHDPDDDKPATASTGPKGITDEQIIAALKSSANILSHAAEKLGVERSGLDRRIKRSNALQEARREMVETLKDALEGIVLQDALGNPKGGVASNPDRAWAVLQKLARDRGYGNSVEVGIRVEDDELTALVRSLNGDPEALRKLRGSLPS